MAGALTAAIAAAFAGSAAPSSDQYFEYTTLLLPGNGTNGAQNNTFLDGSTNNFTITRNGNTTQGTFSPFSQTGWGNYFDGSSNLQISNNAAFRFDTGNFTIEFWLYYNGSNWAGSNQSIASQIASDTVTGWGLFRDAGGTGIAARIGSSLSNYITLFTGSTPATGVWEHYALVRNSSTITWYKNGVNVASTSAPAGNLSDTTQPFYVSNTQWGAKLNNGYISNLRITKGGALYTSNFTPSTTPLTTTVSSGTVSLLTCQSNRFLDNSSNAFTISTSGSPTVVAFSPFNPTASWSAATYGGSGYFDGSGDYLSVPANSAWNLGSGSFCIECWSYPTATQSDRHLFSLNSSGGTGYWTLRYNTGTIPQFIYNNYTVSITSSTAAVINAWNHIAMVSNGTTMSLYLNGARVATGSATSINDGSANPLLIGSQLNVSSREISGYFTDGRVVKGSSVYDPTQTSITVPTAPLTAITNTSLLLNFTNAGVYDATSKNDLETVGNAQISTAISAKWGSGSMAFDGTGDWLKTPASTLWQFGTGDFTIEFWWYPNSLATYQQILSVIDNVGVTGTGQFAITYNTSLGLRFYINTGTTSIDQGSTSGWSAGQWYYIAAVRSGNTLTLYRNGSSIASGSVTGVTIGANVPVYIGGEQYTPHSNNGYLQDVRITKGYARTVTTSPTAAFPTL